MDLDFTWLGPLAILSVWILAAVFLVVFLVAAASRLNRKNDLDSERAHARIMEQQGPPPVMYVAANYRLIRDYADAEGFDVNREKIATLPESLRGFRGHLVIVNGERTHFPLADGMHQEIEALRRLGLVTVEDVRV